MLAVFHAPKAWPLERSLKTFPKTARTDPKTGLKVKAPLLTNTDFRDLEGGFVEIIALFGAIVCLSVDTVLGPAFTFFSYSVVLAVSRSLLGAFFLCLCVPESSVSLVRTLPFCRSFHLQLSLHVVP